MSFLKNPSILPGCSCWYWTMPPMWIPCFDRKRIQWKMMAVNYSFWPSVGSYNRTYLPSLGRSISCAICHLKWLYEMFVRWSLKLWLLPGAAQQGIMVMAEPSPPFGTWKWKLSETDFDVNWIGSFQHHTQRTKQTSREPHCHHLLVSDLSQKSQNQGTKSPVQ